MPEVLIGRWDDYQARQALCNAARRAGNDLVLVMHDELPTGQFRLTDGNYLEAAKDVCERIVANTRNYPLG